jgi:hypothetical protein
MAVGGAGQGQVAVGSDLAIRAGSGGLAIIDIVFFVAAQR